MDNIPLAITVDDAATLLSVSRRTIYRLAHAGRIRIVRITPDAPRVLRADLEAYLASCRIVETVCSSFLAGVSPAENVAKLNGGPAA